MKVLRILWRAFWDGFYHAWERHEIELEIIQNVSAKFRYPMEGYNLKCPICVRWVMKQEALHSMVEGPI